MSIRESLWKHWVQDVPKEHEGIPVEGSPAESSEQLSWLDAWAAQEWTASDFAREDSHAELYFSPYSGTAGYAGGDPGDPWGSDSYGSEGSGDGGDSGGEGSDGSGDVAGGF